MFPGMLSPFHPLNRLREELDPLFDGVLDDFPFAFRTARAYPALNVWEDGENFFAEAEVPGLSMDDLEVLVIGNELTIKGQRKDTQPEGATFHRRERGVGTFTRTLHLPSELNPDKVQAKLVDGVLTITLPKGERAKVRKIKVKALTE